jgi:hypothetical protein
LHSLLDVMAMQPTQSLRSSFQQMVANHQLQRPSANVNRSFHGRKAARQQNRRPSYAPFIQPADAAREWALNAVRADQATDSVDTETLKVISDVTRQVDEQHAAILKGAADEAGAGLAEPDSQLRAKVKASILDLQNGLLERETEVRRGTPLLLLCTARHRAACRWQSRSTRPGTGRVCLSMNYRAKTACLHFK